MLTAVVARLQTRRRRSVAAGLALLILPTACAGPEEGGLEPVYCYRSLADVTCRTVPDPGREGRLVGVYLRRSTGLEWPDHRRPDRAVHRRRDPQG